MLKASLGLTAFVSSSFYTLSHKGRLEGGGVKGGPLENCSTILTFTMIGAKMAISLSCMQKCQFKIHAIPSAVPMMPFATLETTLLDQCSPCIRIKDGAYSASFPGYLTAMTDMSHAQRI